MSTSFGHNSQPRGRLEDARMITGGGRYVDDWVLDAQAHACFVRSDFAHADIGSIDASEALAMPGVLGVLTGDDVAAAGHKPMPAAAPMKGKGGSDQRVPPRYSLARGRVRYVGEPVAIVVAESAALARDAADLVSVDYNELPVVATAKGALAAGAPTLHDEVPGNLVLDFEGGDEAATIAAFAGAARVVRMAGTHTRVIANPMEPRAATAIWHANDERYELVANTQGAGPMRGQLSAMLGVPADKVGIVAEEVGGGFGVRFNAYPEHGALLLAARTLGRPVKWLATRSEVFVADEQARDVLHEGEVALDEQHRIVAMRFHYTSNVGAFLAFTGSFVNTVNLVNVVSGVYDVQAVYISAKLAMTNTAPTAAYRGAGRPVASYALERLIDTAAKAVGMDPAEFRRINLVPKERMPYKIVTGFEYDCGDFEGVMDDALNAADWRGFEARRAESASRGRLRGRGMATYIEATASGGFAPFDQADIRFETDGTITLRTGTHNHGQGHRTTLAQVVSGILGVPMDLIHLRTSEQGGPLMTSNPTGGSRTLLGIGSAMHGAAHEIVENGRTLAAEALECAAADIEFETGRYGIKGTDRGIGLLELVAEHPGKLDLDYRDRPKVPSTFPNGCHVAEVEIDPETGVSEVVRYVACDDAGNVINHQIVHGQMHGGITQGAGHIFLESAVYDENAQLLTGSFMDYAMPRAGLVDNFTLLDHGVPTTTNPLGAKGVGEAGVTGSMPTLMNAVMDALESAGVTEFDMPASPHRLWQALNEATTAEAAE